MKLLTDLANKKTTPQFIFLSPEKIATDGFLEYCLACRKEDIKLLVIDEVHCVSQWGMSFRPFYKRIPDFMNQLFGENKWCKILALTATLNPKELGDICNSFHINKSNIIIQDLLMRSEIQLHTQKFSDEKEKVDKFWEIIKTHQDEKILVYVYRKYSKNGVEDLCASAIERGYKGFILTAKKCCVEPKRLAHDIYRAIVNGTAVTKKALERWLILKINKVDIEETDMEQMLSCIEEKKKYKHDLLDYFVYVLDNNSSSLHLHQEIASYLGTDKHNLNKIYETVDGKHVRSKSEVIICNLLHESGLEYQYEEKLFYDNNKWIEPDFTIKLSNNRKIYWEHVGMLGKEDYDTRWSKKIDIYNRYFPGCMVKTYEGGSLSKDAKCLIEKIKTL